MPFELEEDDTERVPPAMTSRPGMRQCPGCWKAALHSDVRRYVHELAPCYPDCWRNDAL